MSPVATTRLKLAAAVVLLASLALPQSTCAGYRGPHGEWVHAVPAGGAPRDYQRVVRRDYAFHDVYVTRPDTCVAVGVFLWPLPVVAATRRRREWRPGRWLWGLEPLLALGSAWTIWLMAGLFATPAVGAYVAEAALALYLAAWGAELWSLKKGASDVP